MSVKFNSSTNFRGILEIVMNKSSKILVWSTIILSIATLPLFLGFVPAKISEIIEFTNQYPLVGPIILIIWRILAIIIPPLPGGLISIALIPVFGWFNTFIYTTISVVTGSTIAFYLARRYREPFVEKFVPLKQLHEWQEKISEKKQFWAFLGIRFATGSIMDYISYIAGLSKISFKNFILATTISLSSDALLYYIGEKAYKYSAYLAIGLVFFFVAGFYIIKKFKFFKIKL